MRLHHRAHRVRQPLTLHDEGLELLRGLLLGRRQRALLLEELLGPAQRRADLQPLAVAKLLRAVVDKEQPKVVLLGKQAIDDDSNQTGQMLAALLGWPQACFASKVDIAGERVTVKDGVVDLWGAFTSFRQDESAIVAAENVPGVKDVHNHLAWVDPMSGLVIYEADEKRSASGAEN